MTSNAINDQQNFIFCPICSVSETSVQEIEHHINSVHFNSSENGSNSDIMQINYACPLCPKKYETPKNLESHINSDHVDIISPKKVGDKGQSSSAIESCPICNKCGFSTREALSIHIDDHYSLKHPIPKKPKDSKFSVLVEKDLQKAVQRGQLDPMEYHERKIESNVAERQALDDMSSCTTGIVEAVRSAASNLNVSFWLCSNVDHFASSYGDRGWACGYRNIQMILSSLIDNSEYRERFGLSSNRMPSITRIQRWIETAWSAGFDPDGRDQLGGELLGTKKWIGATEVVSLFSYFRIKCELFDFHRATGPKGTHPELLRRCREHFADASADFVPPLYLQHDGHSRTVIGVETSKNKNDRMLILDPSLSPARIKQLRSEQTRGNVLQSITKGLQTLKSKQYQLVKVSGFMASESEYMNNKIMKSIRIP